MTAHPQYALVVVGKPLEARTNCSRAVQSPAYSPDGQHITSGSKDRAIQIWDFEIGTAVCKPLKGHTGRCGPLFSLPMGNSLSPVLMTTPFKSGMPRQALQLASLCFCVGHCFFFQQIISVLSNTKTDDVASGWINQESAVCRFDAATGVAIGSPLRGILCGPLLTLPMGGTLPPDRMTRRFESGMPKLGLQLTSL